ncbi:beta strand repeat-containing protein [Alteromonas sp. A081]|uniref:beta strand repeat-containing protein n=1 Tax=Alteromonas sp. A081 TaxID=3410269 RepID=UPI003B984744
MRTLAKTLSLFSAIFMLTACGGGGSVSRDDTDNGAGNGNGGTTTPTYTVSLALQNTNGEGDNDLSEDNSLTVIATVTDQDGNALPDSLVTFVLDNTALATFSNDTGTARTNADGVARIGINASTASGDGQITASISSGETGTTTFSAIAATTGSTESSVLLTLQNSSGEEDNELSTNNALTAFATVTDADGNPQDDVLLTFSLSNSDLAEFSNDTATALTDENGIASIGMTVSDLSGDGEVTVTLPTGEFDSTTFSSSGRTSVSEQPASLELFADSIQLASSGSDEVELIALVKNEQSVLMEGVEVSFSAPSADGVELQLIQRTTTADGTARALLSTRNNAANRIVTVSAQAGSLSPENVSIEIDGTEVTVNGASSVILNDTVNYTIRVQDSDGTSILNQSVQLEASGGTLGTSEVNTGSTGQATVSYTASESGVNRITATALNATATFTVQVQQDEFNFVNLPTEEIPLGQTQSITIQWRQNNTPVVGEDVTFSASRGVIAGNSTVVTDANGQASIEISADNAGISSITASASDGSGNVLVSALTQIEFIATEPNTLIADASPDILGPDGQTSTISAVVRDINGNLVKNSVVNFSVSDVSTGFVSPSQATTDSKGIATTVFTSGSVSSKDDVVVTASVADDSAIFDDVLLTVGARAFDIVIGTGNVIETPNTTSYLKRFAVFVSDSAGRPVSGVNLTASITPVKFNDISGKGIYLRGSWAFDSIDSIWRPVNVTSCDNEDVDSNGILDVGEDNNRDEQLTPGNVGTVSLTNGGVTDENGYAELEYRYPESYAFWYFAEISVFGQSTGSEARASMKYQLEILGDDITDEGVSPPNNPFGEGDTNFTDNIKVCEPGSSFFN